MMLIDFRLAFRGSLRYRLESFFKNQDFQKNVQTVLEWNFTVFHILFRK